MIVEDYGKDTILISVYPRIYPTTYVRLLLFGDVEVRKIELSDTITVFKKEFVVETEGLLLKDAENSLKETIQKLGFPSYTITYYEEEDEISYEFHDTDTRGEIKGMDVKIYGTLSKRTRFTPGTYGAPDYPFIAPRSIKQDNNKNIVFKALTTMAWPASIALESHQLKVANYKILTEDGTRHIRPRPLSLKMVPHLDVQDFFGLSIIDETPINSPVPLPGFCAQTPAGKIWYFQPDRWIIQSSNGIFSRREKHYSIFDGEDPYGFGKWHYKTNFGDVYGNPELPTGQVPLYAVIKKNRAELFGVITPEGVFSITVPVERLYEERPISVFEKSVIEYFTHIPFPVEITFEKTMFSGGWGPMAIIDDKEIQLPINVTGESIHELFDPDYELLLEYGL